MNNSHMKIKERVQNRDFHKMYTLGEISKWIQWGISKGVISKDKSKENLENIMKWIDLLGKNKFINL